MKLLISTAILSITIPFTLADFIPALAGIAPDASHVKERIAPPANATLYDVYYAKGNRIYQCNPELQGFQHWYNVQTHAFLYPTKDFQAPFDIEGREIGQLAAAPLNPEQQMANPIDTMPVIYNYIDGSWAGTARPLSTTTKEEGRIERGDSVHLDDHLVPVVKSSTNGYLSHAKYIVRLASMNGVVPAAETCVKKGLLINKPFTAYFMFYTDAQGLEQIAQEKIEWDNMVLNYTPEKLAAAKAEKKAAADAAANAEKKAAADAAAANAAANAEKKAAADAAANAAANAEKAAADAAANAAANAEKKAAADAAAYAAIALDEAFPEQAM